MKMTMAVDTAVTVPVNVAALIDSTDFISREESVVYNQAGLDLVWNFVTPAGVQTQTAVTPTDTAGAYDWVNVGNGMYNIEIPASGGASINNDTEGYGWFTGFATGILPWVGPIISFVPAHVVNGLVTGSDSLQVETTSIGSGAITSGAIATGAIDADAIAADAVTEIQSGLATQTLILNAMDAVHVNADTGSAGGNGTPDDPVDTLANAKTLADSRGAQRIHLHGTPGTTYTIASTMVGYHIESDGDCVVALGGQALGCSFHEVVISGIGTQSTGAINYFYSCGFASCTLPANSIVHNARIVGTLTAPVGHIHFFHANGEGGAIDFSTAANTTIRLHLGGGEVTIANLGNTGTDVLYLTGHGSVTLAASCTGGTVYKAGAFVLTNSGASTVTEDDVKDAVDARATPAQVNTEVLDVLTVDTFAEPSAVPAATSTLKDKINWLFSLGRNKLTKTSAGVEKVYADNGSTQVGTHTDTDDGTTYTRSEWQ